MVVEMVKKYVSIATTSCCIFGSRHPLLMFNVIVLFWMYRSFPFLFSILLYASPVIASTLLLLGTLLFFGQSVVPERNDQGDLDNTDNNKLKQQVKSEWVDQKARFQEKKKIGLKSRERSRRNSIDFSGHNRIDDDNKGWETGSDLGSEVPQTHGSTDAASDHSHGSGDMVNETDDYDDDDYSDDDLDDIQVKDDEYDEHENVFMWTDDDQRNAMNMRTSELERNRRLENLIARQKALRNLRMMAEKNMENLSPDLPFNATHSNVGSAPSVMIPLRQPFDFSYDPSDMKHNHVGHTFQTNEPLLSQRRESFDVGPSTFGSSKQGHNLGQYLVPGGTNYLSMVKTDTESIGSAHTEDDPSQEHYTSSGLSKVKVQGSNETGHQEKASSDTSSPSFCDVTDDINDDEEEEEFRSIENPSEDSEDLQITDDDDSEASQTEEGGLPHRLKSWLTRWKA